MSEALRLAALLDAAQLGGANPVSAELRRLHAENEALKAELHEQARVNGMGGERELRLAALNAELVEALHHISLCSQNSMSSQRQCGEIARAALAKVEASNE